LTSKNAIRDYYNRATLRAIMMDYLDSHSAWELFELAEDAVEVKSAIDNRQFERLHSKWLDDTFNAKSGFKSAQNAPELTVPKDVNINRFEHTCKWVLGLIGRTDLKHAERLYLALVYMRMGRKGELRLREILSRQTNYKERITTRQIDAMKLKGMTKGVSCEKIIAAGLCSHQECGLYTIATEGVV